MNSVDSRIVLQDIYETHMGIYNHLNNNSNPLSSVSMMPSEEYTEGSLLDEIIRKYVTCNIKDLYGMSLTDFLELPMDIIDLLFTIANDENEKKAKLMSNIETSMKK